MSEPELVEVVDVGDAEVQRREEDDVTWGDVREDMQRNEGGAKHDFLGDGALER